MKEKTNYCDAGHLWYYRVPGRYPEHWDKLIEISFVRRTYRQNEAHVRHLLRIMLGVKKLPNGTEVWPKTWSAAEAAEGSVDPFIAAARCQAKQREAKAAQAGREKP